MAARSVCVHDRPVSLTKIRRERVSARAFRHSEVEWCGISRSKWFCSASVERGRPVTTLEMAIPDEVFAALRRSPDEFGREMRLAAAVHWYSRGVVSQERAASIADLDRTDFLLALAREGVDAFKVDFVSLRKELEDE